MSENETPTSSDHKPLFIPLIPVSNPDDGKPALRRAYRDAVTQALRIKECAEAIAPYKANGIVYGHPLFDDAAGIEALTIAAPANLKSTLEMTGLNRYEKVRAGNEAMRKYWTMDKKGKLTGAPSKRLLKQQTPPATAETPK